MHLQEEGFDFVAHLRNVRFVFNQMMEFVLKMMNVVLKMMDFVSLIMDCIGCEKCKLWGKSNNNRIMIGQE